MKEPRDYIIRKEPEPLSKTGYVYRALNADGSPVYIGRETASECERVLRDNENVRSVTYETPAPDDPFQPGDFVRSMLSPLKHCGFIMRKAPVTKKAIPGYIVRLASGRDIWIGESDLELIAR